MVRRTMEFFPILHTSTESPGPTQAARGSCMFSLVTALDVPFTVSYMNTLLANLSVSTNVFLDWIYVHTLSSNLYVFIGNVRK
ncbi:hypothetical protein DPMN_131871 [Dreissena polymorpha]|uniref:Uncharacterized protein n=1 Tax=Dreissena polymorpha TaxID=45954 RepID=A0A9D4FV39_DREPO|nr:hypothetical protein DPMN_131871 [Dreissena polymorpha]